MSELRTRTYVAYGAGDFANNLVFSMQGMFLLIYYTNVVGLDPARVGFMFLAVRILGALADLVAGRLVDITTYRWGRFRPYLVFASLPLLLISVATFSVPGFGGNQTFQYGYAWVTYALLGVLYSLVNIPYGSLATAMTQEPVERAKLGIWRSLGPTISMIGLVIVVSPQITRLGANPDALQSFLTATTLVFTVIGYSAFVWCFAECREQVSRPHRTVTVRETLATLRSNRPLVILCISDMVFLTGAFGVQAAQAYYAAYVLGDSSSMIWMIVATSVAAFLGVPIMPRVVRRIGKKGTYYVGAVRRIAVGVWMFLMPTTLVVVYASFFVMGIFQNFGMALAFVFQADTVEYGEWKNGVRTEGTTYAIYSFFRKIAQAVAGAATGYALAFGGFVVKAPRQAESALVTIRGIVGLGPAVFALLGGALFLAYPLTDTRYRESWPTFAPGTRPTKWQGDTPAEEVGRRTERNDKRVVFPMLWISVWMARSAEEARAGRGAVSVGSRSDFDHLRGSGRSSRDSLVDSARFT